MKQTIKPCDTTVMIFAAGRGARMLELTESRPKPLLKVGQFTLIEHHLRRLSSMGFRQIVINIAYLGEQIREALADGKQFGLEIQYSDESKSGALETAGGIVKALKKINSDPFITVNADIWTDFKFGQLLAPEKEACLVMVDNPSHNANGDYYLLEDGKLSISSNSKQPKLTFSGIAIYRKSFFTGLNSGKQALAPIFNQRIDEGKIQAIKYNGDWTDVGTPQRLHELNTQFAIAKQ